MTKREEIIEQFSDFELIFFDGFDEAILGVVERFSADDKFGGGLVVLYDEDKFYDILRREQHMSYDEAIEYFEFNVKGAYVGEGTPAFATLL